MFGEHMIKVKVFDEEHEDDLTEAINEFIEKEQVKVCDIKFSTAAGMMDDEQIYCFSALLIYMHTCED
jgi:predicted DNA-binding protein with PD1-like motif